MKKSNPWISKGTKHLFDDSCIAPVNAQPSVISSQDAGVHKDLFIHSKAKSGERWSESDLSVIRIYLESIRSQIQVLTEKDGKTVDSGVLDGFATIGFDNDGNYCYQNSILQVHEIVGLNVVSSSHTIILRSPKSFVSQVW